MTRRAEKFVTVHSEPISVHVEPADTLALDAVIGRSTTSANESHGPTVSDASAASPRLTNFAGDDLLTNESPPATISRPLALLLTLPPLVVLGILIVRTRRGFSTLFGRFGSSVRRCQTRIEKSEQPAEVAHAMQTLLAKRFGLSGSTVDAVAVVGALRSAGYRNLAVRCERLLRQCEQPGYGAFGGGPSLSELKRDALQLIVDLESQRRPSQVKPVRPARKVTRLRSSASSIVVGIALAGAMLGAGRDAGR